MDIKDINAFHQSENVDTKNIVQHMMSNFYDYIMVSELAANPSTPQIVVGNNQYSLYFHNNHNRRQSISAEAILLERIDAKFITYQNSVAGT